LLSKNVKIEVYTTIIFPVDLYGSETWPLTLSEEHTRTRLKASENKMLRKIFGPKRDTVIEIYISRSFITCILVK
jgi:hypothetical protein